MDRQINGWHTECWVVYGTTGALSLWVRMRNGIAILENKFGHFYKVKYKLVIQPSNSKVSTT